MAETIVDCPHCRVSTRVTVHKFAGQTIPPMYYCSGCDTEFSTIWPGGSLLEERGATHGDYTKMSALIQDLKQSLKRGTNWDRLTPAQKESLELIATKIGRIVEGDPNHRDHWDDIAGYARLAGDRIPQPHEAASKKD